MKKHFTKIAIAITAILTIGTVTLVSCNKEENVVPRTTSSISMKSSENVGKIRTSLFNFYSACDRAYQKDSLSFLQACSKNDSAWFLELTGVTTSQLTEMANLCDAEFERFIKHNPDWKDDQESPCEECAKSSLSLLGQTISATSGHLAEIVPATLVRDDYGRMMTCIWKCIGVPPCGHATCIASCMGRYFTDKYMITLYSYTGDKFMYDPSFVNDKDDYGRNHNALVSVIDENWGKYENDKLFSFAITATEKILGYRVESTNSRLSTSDFVAYLVPLLANDKASNYIEMLEHDFSDIFNEEAIDNFLSDIYYVTYSNLTFDEMLYEISKIEQKIAHSKITNDRGIELGLIFSAVYKYSIINIEKILNTPSSNFYQPLIARANKKESASNAVSVGSAVLADATGAVRGARMGATAGVAGGPQGMVLMGTIGAVCVGGMATAVDVAITQKITNWIDGWFSK